MTNGLARLRLAGWQLAVCSAVSALCLSAACGDGTVVFDDDGTAVTAGPGGGGGAGGMGSGGGGVGGASTSSQVDVLLVVDNSRGVGHMQAVLADSVASLVTGLNDAGVRDMHLGVITSSLGGLGADACSGASSPTENDRAWLIARGDVETYQGLGFLNWDPEQQQTPPGEEDAATLAADLGNLVLGAGDLGCGYESQLEAFYRFLIDPDPYADVQLENNAAVLVGTDSQLLQQRADFLRPDSLLLIVIATDENDCSTRDGGQFYFSRQIYQPGTNNPYHLPPPRAACETDPNSPCCVSCGQDPEAGCDTSQDQCGGSLSALDDNINLRCFDQKRRFGIDFLWPIDRYTAGLSAAQVTDRYGNVVANPLFAGGRGTELVLVTGIVGVPYQLVARGADATAMKTGDEVATDPGWSALIGNPAAYVAPSEPHMIESIDPRAGVPGPGSEHDADPYVGHDFSVPQKDDIQYACVWDLPTPVDCLGQQNCVCNDALNDNPACQDPVTNIHGTTQYRGVARPGTRPLTLLQSLGHRAVVGSICPPQIDDPGGASFGYTPAFSTLVDLASERLVD